MIPRFIVYIHQTLFIPTLILLNQKVFKLLKLNYNYENNNEPKRNIL